jgi:superfamily II DNA or RNA helicase
MNMQGQDKQAVERAMAAIGWLVARCDMATSADGAGFGSTDAPLGQALAEKSIWSLRETLAAGRLVVKYRKQLEKGLVDLAGIDALMLELGKNGNSGASLRKRDIVKGSICVDEASARIILSTSYHEKIVPMCREMFGSRWDAVNKRWTADLCAENAAQAEDIAQMFGLDLQRPVGWSRLLSARKVEVVDQQLIIRGVRAWTIVRSLPALTGKPLEDEQVFSALLVVDKTSIAIPLRSWVIRDALLWLETMDRDDANFSRLNWVRDEVIGLLQQAYAGAQAAERGHFAQAGAIRLAGGAQAVLQASLPPSVSERLMPHQWVAVKSIVEQNQIILADQQGLGKTIEILAALESVQAFPAVVIAPATALLNWRDETANWLPHRRVAVLGGGVGKRDQGVPVAEADILIINYESFSKYAQDLAAVHPKALVADEAQYLKGHDSKRTDAVKQFCQNCKMDRLIIASGTPVMNRPSELLTLLTLLPSALADIGGFVRFASRYCQATYYDSTFSGYWDFSGAANLGELANRLRESGRFIRRDKAAVLPGLAGKDRDILDVEIINRRDYQLAKNDFNAWLKKRSIPHRQKARPRPTEDDEVSAISASVAWLGWKQEDVDSLYLDQGDRAEAIRRMGTLRQLAGVGKIAAALHWIRRCIKDRKLVVFAYHIEVQEALLAGLSDAGIAALSITGDMPIRARRDAILQFQDDPASMVIVCSLKASQTAITLTAAQCALMVELDWTPTSLEQAEDRLHRIGQNGQVCITYLHAVNTMDDRMVEILDTKRAKISVLSAVNAPHGYRKDGTPRLQPAGPGRPRLAQEERDERRKSSKTGWQARNTNYMRDYMRQVRLKKKVKQAELDLEDYATIKRLGRAGMALKMNGADAGRLGNTYRDEEFTRDLAGARAKAEIAQQFLDHVKNMEQASEGASPAQAEGLG